MTQKPDNILNNVPRHVGIIMDGNRRWAKRNKLKAHLGHEKGSQNIEPIITELKNQKVKTVSLYAFSRQNRQREEREIKFLKDLIKKYLSEDQIQRIIKEGGRINVVGDLEFFGQEIIDSIKKIEKDSKNNKEITINICLNYDSRWEMEKAMKRTIKNEQEITEENIKKNLLIPDDLDLLIRTGDEYRLSNFLLWQSGYAEIFTSQKLWPDFNAQDTIQALEFFASRDRRMGR